MKRVILLIFALVLPILTPQSSEAKNDAVEVFSWGESGINLSISLENLSRPTLINTFDGKKPLFLKGDRVRYEVRFTSDPSDPIWLDAKADIASKFPNEKTIVLDVSAQLSLMSGDVELFAPWITYNYLSNSYSMRDQISGEFTMNANNELVLNEAYVHIEWASEDANKDVDADVFKIWNIVSPSKANPHYLYRFTGKVVQYLSYPIMPKLGLQHGSVRIPIISSSGLPVQVTSLSPLVCSTQSTYAVFLKTGTCKILLRQPGSAIYAPAKDSVISFPIVKSTPASIVCGNSFRMIEVPGKSSKCPQGLVKG